MKKSALSSHLILDGEIYTEILDKDFPNVRPGQYINRFGIIYTPNSYYQFRYPVFGCNKYGRVKVYNNEGKLVQTSLHRILMSVFNPVENMENLVVNHKNGNKRDNSIMNNLEWVTIGENNIHAFKTGLNHVGEKSHAAKLTENQVKEICIELQKDRQYGTINSLARKYNVSDNTIRRIANGNNWREISCKFNLDYSVKGIESILTEIQVREICEILSNTDKYKGLYTDLAKIYDVSPNTIKQIAYRKSWNNISQYYDF